MEERSHAIPISRYNCGGFSLKTYNWYLPYGTDEFSENREDFIADTFVYNSYRDAKDIITAQDAEYVSKEFEFSYFITDNISDCPELEVGDILYRIAFPSEKDIEEEYYDYDFHFVRVIDKNDGEVMIAEKLGNGRIENRVSSVENLIYSPWKRGFWLYDGPVVVFRENFTSF